MVAYSFRPRFVAAIVSGRKRQTIRAARKRHARAGEAVQLYTGMRTKQCRLIGVATCEAVREIALDFEHNAVRIEGFAAMRTEARLNSIAVHDGFHDWEEMRAFWAAAPTFSGFAILWRDFKPSAEVGG